MGFATEKGYIEAVSRGDEQALESLFLHYYPRIKGFISGLLQNEEEADDIGYGNLGCYGATKIKTPAIDEVTTQGIKFTNAYAPASTSSPSRYALLTGEYAWRKNVGILPADAPLTIDPNKNTFPAFLRKAGYHTGLVGKWHLGLGEQNTPVDFNEKIQVGPLAIGFDYAYYFPATNDRVPCIYIENETVDMLATFAGILNIPVTEEECNDSKNGAALFSDPNAPLYRQYIITQNNSGLIAIRKGDWKYIPAYKNHAAELYSLSTDPSELHGMILSCPEKVRELSEHIKQDYNK